MRGNGSAAQKTRDLGDKRLIFSIRSAPSGSQGMDKRRRVLEGSQKTILSEALNQYKHPQKGGVLDLI